MIEKHVKKNYKISDFYENNYLFIFNILSIFLICSVIYINFIPYSSTIFYDKMKTNVTSFSI